MAQTEPMAAPVGLEPVDVLLSDGLVAQVRAAAPDDAPRISELLARLSADSRFFRYFGSAKQPDPAEVARLCRVGPDHVSLVALVAGSLVAVAEYSREVGSEEAEVAFVVDDAYQGRGIGTLLLEHLAVWGRHNGVRRFVADVLPENHRMLDVFEEAGFASALYPSDGDVRVVLDIAPSQASLEAAWRRDVVATVASMRRLLEPRSVAVVGASRQRGTVGHEILLNLIRGGFQGPVYPVNPAASHVASMPAWPSLAALPGPVDLAVIAVPAAKVEEVVASCEQAGVGALVVVTAGFAEAGPEGAELQRRIACLAHAQGIRLVGPNCFGVINTDPSISLNATFAPDLPLPGTVGFASQSGGLGIAILAEARARGLGLSGFVSMGNKADVSGNDLLAYWGEDSRTNVILLYLESFGNPAKFARLARQVSMTKPIVAVAGGRTSVGARAASSHTAALTSPAELVEALFTKSGVIRVNTVEELFDAAEVLSTQPIPTGRRVAIVTNVGGPGVLAADACAQGGLEVPELSSALQAQLREIQPSAGGVRNPVDLGAAAPAEAYRASLEAIASSGEVDALLVTFTPPLVTQGEDVATAIVQAQQNSKHLRDLPLVANFFGTEQGRAILAKANPPIPCFTYPETAVRALAHAVYYGAWRARQQTPPPPAPELGELDSNRARKVAAMAASAGGWVTGAAAMEVLSSFGIPVLETVEVTSGEEAARAAERLGFPVVLKVSGPSILHKSDVGGVRLGLANAAEVAAAYEELSLRLGEDMTGAVLQRMAEPGVETICGILQDPQFGPVVAFGLGGVTVELLGDHKVALAPLDAREARDLVLGLKGSRLLTGYRGSRPVDLDSLVEVVLRMSRLAIDLPEALEADCNPIIATEHGAVVADARIRFGTPNRRIDERRRLR